MRTAPPVSVRCRDGRGWRCVQAGIPALAAAALGAWAAGWLEFGAAAAPAVAGFLGLGVAWLAWRGAEPQTIVLAWDGQCWRAGSHTGRLEVMLDLGGWLLLRLRPQSATAACWIAVDAADAGPSMHALRAAIYSRAPAGGLPVSPTRVPD